MKKAYLFCFEGMVYVLDEDGYCIECSVTSGFFQNPKILQDKFLIEKFKEFIKKLSVKYVLICVSNESEKKELLLVVKKKIDYEKNNHRDTGDVEFWEEVFLYIQQQTFDVYNKDIFEKISPTHSV